MACTAVHCYALAMVRPASQSRLAGEIPVRVGLGVSGSRPRFVAAHGTAKAMPGSPVPTSTSRVFRGNRGRHAHSPGRSGISRPARLAPGKDQAHKTKADLPGGQQEPDGPLLTLLGGLHNAPDGKGPHFDCAAGAGTRHGMAGSPRPNSWGGSSPASCRRRPSACGGRIQCTYDLFERMEADQRRHRPDCQ